MLLEGAFYAAAAAVVLVPVTAAFSLAVMPGIVENLSWVSVYQFDLTPLWIMLALILAAALLTPQACLRFVTKGTIRQRLGTTG